MAKAKQRFTWDRNATTGEAIKTDTSTGETFAVSLAQFPEEIQAEIAVYGLTKVLDDRGSQVDADQKIAFCQVLVPQLEAGNWKAERTGGIHLLPLVIEAIVESKECSVTAAQTAYRLLDEEQRVVLKTNLAKSMTRIAEARKLAEEVELGDLLS